MMRRFDLGLGSSSNLGSSSYGTQNLIGSSMPVSSLKRDATRTPNRLSASCASGCTPLTWDSQTWSLKRASLLPVLRAINICIVHARV